MRRLMLLRHAKSDWSKPGAGDHGRGLASRGQEAAPKIGTYMATHALVPDKALVSTATRARDTWALVTGSFDAEVPTIYDERLYEAEPEKLLAVVRETGRDVHALLLVGHNPALQEFAHLLIASGDVNSRRRLIEKFPTASLAVIDFPVDDWRKLHAHGGRLDRFVTPRYLATSTD